jgi:type IV pilus assembly protein PilB
MEVTDDVAKAIQAEVPEEQLRKIATQEGMVPLRRAGLKKAKQGITSVREVLRRTVVHGETMPAYLVNPEIEEYEDGDIIIQEGNKDDRNFYMLVRGKVAVLKNGKKMAEVTEPGEYFGEMACILDQPRSASVVAIGRCKVKRYPGEKINELIEKYPDISSHLFKTMARRLRTTGTILIQLAGGARGPKPQAIRQA